MNPRTVEFRKNLAESFLCLMESDPGQWRMGWNSPSSAPFNGASKRPYNGVNRLTLHLASEAEGYEDPRWYTFHQAVTAGFTLKNARGKGVSVEYWMPYDMTDGKAIPWNAWDADPDKQWKADGYGLRARYYTVFNGDLLNGLPPLSLPERNTDVTASDTIRLLSEGMDVSITNDGGCRSFYRPSDDTIHLPEAVYFKNSSEYNSTALHELAHASGAPKRLDRNLSGLFGDDWYAFEELVAEMTACFMLPSLPEGFEDSSIRNSEAYIHCWAVRIRNDPDALVKAVKLAAEASSYMDGILDPGLTSTGTSVA